jgi:glutamate racemase
MNTPTTSPQCAVVGVFDSGVGGLSVLQVLRAHLRHTPLIYVADSAHAPYGERPESFVIERSSYIAQHLIEQGANLLVMACNTATAAAVAHLRARWPHVGLVGIEPGIKPAVKISPNGRIGVMATPLLLRSEKFNRLLNQHRGQAQWHLQPCPGLAALIEQGNLNDPALVSLIKVFCEPLKQAGVDTVVLGCTHYPFVRQHIQVALGGQVQLIDTADAVARQTLRLLHAEPGIESKVRLQTTGDVAQLTHLASAWLDFPFEVCSV